ncbi:MFS transporter [Streptomyces fulvoviolaceus]|uniref:MFS transporter n=1 Tax=Streptomyces fulvoviolaceus TaxID=285535 RepID=UPI0004C4BED5|nr:MFS transporter [Streptomyces fulvoviolaceus]MCT9077932.1 MFS transporter [Streptomyces fulvoviolaceus]
MPIWQTRQPLPREVRLLVAARAVNRLGAFSLSFLTVLITTRFGANATTAGVISAAFGLATIPSRLVGGRLADRLGRRRTIVVGLTACALAQLGIAAADSLVVVTVFAILLGLAFELYEPPSQAMIADLVAADERVRAYSLLNAALAAAGMAAGLLAAALGRWDLRWMFVVDALTCSICAAVVHLTLPANRPTPARTAQGPQRSVSPWRDPALLLMLGCGTLMAVVCLQVMMLLPLALVDRGLQAADAGLLSTASAVTLVAGQPLVRAARVAMLPMSVAFAVGYGLMTLGLIGYACAHGLPAYVVSTIVWSAGDLVLVGRAYAIVAELAPEHHSGRYMAVYGLSWGVAAVVAPIAGTELLQRAGVTALWATMAGVCLALAFLQPAVARAVDTRRTRPALETTDARASADSVE